MVDNARVVYRSRTNKFISISGWALLGLGVVGTFYTGRLSGLLGLVPIAAIALIIWELFWRPVVVIDDDGVTLVNQFHTIGIPWAQIVDVDTKWALTIVTPEHRYRASAAPAPGAAGLRPDTSGAKLTGRVSEGSIRRTDAPSTDSGATAFYVRRRLESMATAGTIPIGQAAESPVTTRVHWLSIVAILALVGASIPALLSA